MTALVQDWVVGMKGVYRFFFNSLDYWAMELGKG